MAARVLYRPPDEMTALLLKSFLEGDGILVILKEYGCSKVYDGLHLSMKPEWGEVLVSEEDYPRAKELLSEFLKKNA